MTCGAPRIEPAGQRDHERREDQDRGVVVEQRRRDHREREHEGERVDGASACARGARSSAASRSNAPTSWTTPVMTMIDVSATSGRHCTRAASSIAAGVSRPVGEQHDDAERAPRRRGEPPRQPRQPRPQDRQAHGHRQRRVGDRLVHRVQFCISGATGEAANRVDLRDGLGLGCRSGFRSPSAAGFSRATMKRHADHAGLGDRGGRGCRRRRR